jgi:hypothetical protein
VCIQDVLMNNVEKKLCPTQPCQVWKMLQELLHVINIFIPLEDLNVTGNTLSCRKSPDIVIELNNL